MHSCVSRLAQTLQFLRDCESVIQSMSFINKENSQGTALFTPQTTFAVIRQSEVVSSVRRIYLVRLLSLVSFFSSHTLKENSFPPLTQSPEDGVCRCPQQYKEMACYHRLSLEI